MKAIMNRPIEQRVGKKIRHLRLQEGMTQVKLSRRCGITRGYLCDIENGRRMPSFKVVAQLFETMGYEVVFEKRHEVRL